MARNYEKLTTMRSWPNTNGKGQAKYGNANWKPFKNGAPGDIHLRADGNYSVQAYENDDGSLGVTISMVKEYEGGDDIRDGISQGGMKKLADTVVKPDQLDDDIPF